MAKAKSSSSTRKISFGRRKGGKACKSFNKHNSKSSFYRRNASRSGA